MTKPIEVTFDQLKWNKVGSETLCGLELLAKLRKAGVPAVGRIMLQGVSTGTLTYKTDQTFGDAIYTWTPDEPEDDEEL